MDAISAKRSYKEGCVSVRFSLKGGYNLKAEGATDLTTVQARELAKALLAEADRADAKVAAKEASGARRKKWRDREIAAGRLKVISVGSFFGKSQ